MKTLAAKIDSSTPAHRDRAIDGLRALALLAVPTGHWLLGGFTLSSDGAIHNASPLGTFAGLAPVSWVLQMLGIFFLVGGYASVLSYRRRKGSTRAWLGGRLARLGRPVLGVTAVWAALLPVLHFGLGVPVDTLRTASTLVIQPLWFVGVYTVVTALTPLCVRAARRLGVWAAAPLLGSVAAVDFLRYGPYADAVPSWLSLLNILPGWLLRLISSASRGARAGSTGATRGRCCWAAPRSSPPCSSPSATRRRWSASPARPAPTRTRRRCSSSPSPPRRAARRSCCGTGSAGS
ncbi:hypothetical protein STANM309S_05310 [Streptomyces tanashiensis]